jgi:hypothetical protein
MSCKKKIPLSLRIYWNAELHEIKINCYHLKIDNLNPCRLQIGYQVYCLQTHVAKHQHFPHPSFRIIEKCPQSEISHLSQRSTANLGFTDALCQRNPKSICDGQKSSTALIVYPILYGIRLV